MKRASIILLASILFMSCNQLNTETYFDGSAYDIHTYSTGIGNVPKQAFDIEWTTTNSKSVDSLKQAQIKIGESFVKNY